MIDEIVEMIFKEARGRKDQDFEVAIMMVFFEVTDSICDTINTIKVEKIKNIRLKFRRKNP